MREAAKLTQEELASRAGLSAKGIGAIERGERRHPHPHTVRVLAAALGLADAEGDALFGAAPKRIGMAFAPPTALGGTVSVLPEPPTPLVGRGREVAALRAMLEPDGARLVTLTGPGGVGKTRLALEVAGGVEHRFPDGVAFATLDPISDPVLLIPTIARVLGLRVAEEQTMRERVQGYLRKKRLLLVLDNLEHLLEAAPEVAVLLSACPSLKVLVTSRAPLRVRGEREYPVGPLPVPDLARMPEVDEVSATPAVELFVERARLINPSFSLTRQNAGSVAEICRRLDGLPLAIELAAARARFLDPAELLSRLEPALEAGHGARDLPERQRTIRATLDWSFGLLSEGERALFQRLSVFTGGFTLEAAEVVSEVETGAPDVLDLLGRLVEQSLVTVQGGLQEGEGRYRMLEPVRQYALGWLKRSGEEEPTRRRHAAYYLALAEHASPELRGGEQVAWLGRLEREYDNLRVTIGWLLDHGQSGRAARLVWGVWLFLAMRGHSGEGRAWMERALASGGDLDDVGRARALCVISALLFAGGAAKGSSEFAGRAVEHAGAAGDEEVLALATMLSGLAAMYLGDLSSAQDMLARALAMGRERDDRWGTSQVLIGLAQVALIRENLGRSAELLDEGESVARESEDSFTLAVNLNTQATIAQLRGDDQRTADLLMESVGLLAALRDTWSLLYGVLGLAGVAARKGDPERAAHLFGAAEALREKTGAVPAFPATQALYERDLASLRAQLPTEMFEAAWAGGRTMTLEETVAVSLAQDN